MATEQQMQTIKARAYNDCARDMQANGVTLQLHQEDELTDEDRDWMLKRLGLTPEETGSACHYVTASD